MSIPRRRKPKKSHIEDEQLIVRGVVVSKEFTEQLISIYDGNLIASDYNRTIIKWAINFFQDNGNVPGASHFSDVFVEKTRHMEPEEAENYEVTLAYISDKSELEVNPDYLLTRAVDYLNKRKTEQLQLDLKTTGRKGKDQDQLKLIQSFSPVELLKAGGVNPFTDAQVVSEAFNSLQKPLFTFPGAFGKMVNHQFTRDSFVAFLGREKIGKTWMLMEIAFKALRARRKVAIFQVGDMSQSQYVRRMGIRCAGISDMPQYLGKTLIPVVDCIHNQTGECEDRPASNYEPVCEEVLDDEGNPTNRRNYADFWENEDHEPCVFCKNYRPDGDSSEDQTEALETRKRFGGSSWFQIREAIPFQEALDDFKASQALSNWYKKYHEPTFKLSTHPTGTISVKQIRGILKTWERIEGFSPDVIVIDYADILAPNDPSMSFRHQQDNTWASLRALSTEFNCNLTTATQADSASYTQFLLSLQNFSEDKRKFAHVTAFFGLNQLPEEKKRKIMRVNPLMMREADFDSKSYVTVLQSPQTGKAYIDSF